MIRLYFAGSLSFSALNTHTHTQKQKIRIAPLSVAAIDAQLISDIEVRIYAIH